MSTGHSSSPYLLETLQTTPAFILPFFGHRFWTVADFGHAATDGKLHAKDLAYLADFRGKVHFTTLF